MRLKCERIRLTVDVIARLSHRDKAERVLFESTFAVDVGRTYEPLGLYWHRGLIWVYILDSFERVRPAPLPLFTVEDGTMPPTWRVTLHQDGALAFIAPPEASDLYFVDRVESGEPEALVALRRILSAHKGDG